MTFMLLSAEVVIEMPPAAVSVIWPYGMQIASKSMESTVPLPVYAETSTSVWIADSSSSLILRFL